jgi:hypothetical protein
MRPGIGAAGSLVLAGLIGGCGGSSGYISSAQGAVASMRDAVNAYNGLKPSSVGATARACQEAADRLRKTSMPAPKDAPANKRVLATTLLHAYQLAVRGFDDCAAGGSKNAYLMMAQGAQEIDDANTAIAAARRLDR